MPLLGLLATLERVEHVHRRHVQPERKLDATTHLPGLGLPVCEEYPDNSVRKATPSKHESLARRRVKRSGHYVSHSLQEAHTGIDEKIPWLERLRQLRELRSTLVQHAVPLRVLLLLRLRDPFEHYLSFFLWAVVERQARAPAKFGSSFEEWMRRVPNLQSELLLSSKAAPTAGFAPRRHPEIRAWAERWGSPQAAAERRSLVWRTLEQFDVRWAALQPHALWLCHARRRFRADVFARARAGGGHDGALRRDEPDRRECAFVEPG